MSLTSMLITDFDMFKSRYDLGLSWIRGRHTIKCFSKVEFSVVTYPNRKSSVFNLVIFDNIIPLELSPVDVKVGEM